MAYSTQNVYNKNENVFIVSNTSEQRSINDENNLFIDYIENNVQPIFLSLIQSEEISVDYMGPAESILRDLMVQNFSATVTWFNNFYVKFYNNDKIVLNLLKIIGNLEEYLVQKFGYVTALSSFSHKNMEIKEMALRAFENWGSIESLTVLKQQSLSPNWLDEYRIQIISDIEENLCLS